MKTKTYKTCLLLTIVFLLLHGCASTPKFLSSKDQNEIKSITLITVQKDDQMSVLDITQIRQQAYSRSYGGAMYGAVGGALEALIKEGISSYKINSLIGGSIDPIKESISGYNTKAAFDDLVFRGITQNMKELNKNHNVRILDVRILDRSLSGEQRRSNDADVLMKIEYKYGIGAYVENKPLPAMIAKISVESLPDNRTLMKNTWTACGCEQRNYTIGDYAKDDGRIYKQCFEEMVEQFGRNLVNVFY